MIIKQTSPARHKKAVIFCCDRNVVDFAAFITTQILLAEPNPDFDICITTLDEFLVEPDQVDARIRTCLIKGDVFEGLAADERIPIAGYLRLALPKAFEDDYERIIYLDTDIYLQNGCMSDLFEAAPVGQAVSGVMDVMQWLGVSSPGTERYWRVTGVNEAKYMNSGVIVFDVQACNAQNLFARFMETARKIPEWMHLHPDVNFMHDQSALNATLKGDWHALSLRWNWQLVRYNARFINEFQPHLLHFVGSTKPWLKNARPYAKKYLHKQLSVYQDIFANQLHKTLPSPTFVRGHVRPEISPEALQASLERVPKSKKPLRPMYFLSNLGLAPKFTLRPKFKRIEKALAEGRPPWPRCGD